MRRTEKYISKTDMVIRKKFLAALNDRLGVVARRTEIIVNSREYPNTVTMSTMCLADPYTEIFGFMQNDETGNIVKFYAMTTFEFSKLLTKYEADTNKCVTSVNPETSGLVVRIPYSYLSNYVFAF